MSQNNNEQNNTRTPAEQNSGEWEEEEKSMEIRKE